MEHILEISDLEIGFLKENKVVSYTDGINLYIDQGEIVGIVGESGCGKSITALSVLGLLGQNARVTRGKILYDQKNLLTLNKHEMNKVRGNEIAMVFQDALASLNPMFTIGNQMVEAICAHQKISKKEAKRIAEKTLDQAGLVDVEGVMKKYPHTLSGGMRQRVMIAMALCCDPKVLIADEPTTALDVTIQAQIMRTIKDLKKKRNLAVLLITHDIGLVAEMADRVVVMYAGQIVEEADVFTLFSHPKHPYTKALLESVPDLQPDSLEELRSIPGMIQENYMETQGCRFQERCPYAAEACKQKQIRRNVGKQHYVLCNQSEIAYGEEDGSYSWDSLDQIAR